VPALTAHALAFSDASYAGENGATERTGNADGGPETPDRTREGHFDVFEMGEVTGNAHGSADAVAAANCGAIAAAWSAGGYWGSNADADLSPPAGGLYGIEYVIDVARGTMFGVDAAAIDGFRSAPLHTAPGDDAPDLDSASAQADGRYAALVIADGAPRALEYDDPVDAVSALFMAESLEGNFTRSAAIGAETDWIVTAPTKRWYVDPAIVDNARPPFETSFIQHYTAGQMTSNGVVTETWASSFPYACANVAAIGYGRDGVAIALGASNDGGSVDPASPMAANPGMTPCLETSVLTFSIGLDAANAEVPQSAIGSRLTNAADPGEHVSRVLTGGVELLPSAGSVSLDLVHDMRGDVNPAHALAAASNGDVLRGLPVIAFSATTFVNGDVANGVLANYGASAAVRSRVACVNAAGSCR